MYMSTTKNYFKCEKCGELIEFGNVIPSAMFLTCKKCGGQAWFVGKHKDFDLKGARE